MTTTGPTDGFGGADAAFERLAGFANFERQPPGASHRFGLDSMFELCEALGRPHERLGQVVQIAGSKGKGTAAVFLSSMLHALSVSTATYLSPHLVDVCERVLWRGRMVTRHELARYVDRACDVAGEHNTWFEVLSAAAFALFADKQPEVTVLEVGLGGRLDSTTVAPKRVCGITTIELEHTEVLGDTIEQIAREKAGILRPEVVCVTMAHGAALDVIRAVADETGATLLEPGRDHRVLSASRIATGFDVVACVGGRELHVEVPVASGVQVQGFVFALALLAQLLPDRWIEITRLPAREWLSVPAGRFELLERDPPLVLDGAHTNASMAALADDLDAAFPGQRFDLVVGIASGKRWRVGLGRLASLVDRAWVAPLRDRQTEDAAKIVGCLAERGVVCTEVGSIREATECALESRRDGRGVLVTGSFYAVGEARSTLV